MSMRRLYVLTDKSLEPVYACVQGGHVVAQWLLEHPGQEWNNSYLIYLSADISEWKQKLLYGGFDFSEFYEPDLDGKCTALAIENDGKIFRKLKTIKANGDP